MKTTSKSKTFHKGDDCCGEILDFVMSNLETDDYTPEGVASYNDGLSPHDPRSDLKFKYVITITKILPSMKTKWTIGLDVDGGNYRPTVAIRGERLKTFATYDECLTACNKMNVKI